MTLHADALRCLTAWDPPPGRQSHLRSNYLTHLHAHPDGMERSCFPDHLTAGVIVLSPDLDHVLLNLHGKAKRWFAFGGHCEPADTTLVGAALREGLEESGLERLDIDPVPVQLDLHEVDFCDPRGTVHHLDVRFTALAPEGPDDSAHRTSDESLDVRWWSVNALPEGLEDDMHALVSLARERWASRR
ncbi:NUDIX hydrolase [Nocardioides gilvus]|uniref:NUDIX hydrolase n=1 Tax=Nocardioides gilvus TaxID=1735589 RepID=UPI000D748316|nr:NUDIX domain-containing protein [Nocardioides gilvus]